MVANVVFLLGVCRDFRVTRAQPEAVPKSRPPRIGHELVLRLFTVVKAARFRSIFEVTNVSKPTQIFRAHARTCKHTRTHSRTTAE